MSSKQGCYSGENQGAAEAVGPDLGQTWNLPSWGWGPINFQIKEHTSMFFDLKITIWLSLLVIPQINYFHQVDNYKLLLITINYCHQVDNH